MTWYKNQFLRDLRDNKAEYLICLVVALALLGGTYMSYRSGKQKEAEDSAWADTVRNDRGIRLVSEREWRHSQGFQDCWDVDGVLMWREHNKAAVDAWWSRRKDGR